MGIYADFISLISLFALMIFSKQLNHFSESTCLLLNYFISVIRFSLNFTIVQKSINIVISCLSTES